MGGPLKHKRLRLGRLGRTSASRSAAANSPSGCCGRWRSSEENLHASGLFLHCGVGMEQEESACRGMEEAERSAPRLLARRFRNHSFKATQLKKSGSFRGLLWMDCQKPLTFLHKGKQKKKLKSCQLVKAVTKRGVLSSNENLSKKNVPSQPN